MGDHGVETYTGLVMRRAFMLYTVELNFSDPAREEAWHAWYETYLAHLVSLPGLSTAQRFRAVDPGAQPWSWLQVFRSAQAAHLGHGGGQER
jgi:hypothetical protein